MKIKHQGQEVAMTAFSVWVIIFIVLNLLIFPKDISTLRLLRVDVPKLVLKGDLTTLRCEYELEGDKLYSVLWYKDHEEFYRFVPRNDPKQHSYKLEGFKVETHKSNDQQVLLRNINLKASGVYRCEVSAEAPSFTSVHGEGRMEVVVPPKENPEITGARKIYHIGDVLSINCSSGKSYPPARLKWFVNNMQISPDYEAVFQHHGLLTTIVSLNLEIQSQHFIDGRMMIRCLSTMYNVRNAIFESNLAHPIDSREALLMVEGGGNVARISKWIIILPLLVFLT